MNSPRTCRKRRGGNKNGGRNEASAKTGGQAPLTMCELCGIGFVHINSLDVHMKTEHFWGKFKCQRCEFKAGFASELIAHMGRNTDPPVCSQFDVELRAPNLFNFRGFFRGPTCTKLHSNVTMTGEFICFSARSDTRITPW